MVDDDGDDFRLSRISQEGDDLRAMMRERTKAFTLTPPKMMSAA
jgi:hypothetical protein